MYSSILVVGKKAGKEKRKISLVDVWDGRKADSALTEDEQAKKSTYMCLKTHIFSLPTISSYVYHPFFPKLDSSQNSFKGNTENKNLLLLSYILCGTSYYLQCISQIQLREVQKTRIITLYCTYHAKSTDNIHF